MSSSYSPNASGTFAHSSPLQRSRSSGGQGYMRLRLDRLDDKAEESVADDAASGCMSDSSRKDVETSRRKMALKGSDRDASAAAARARSVTRIRRSKSQSAASSATDDEADTGDESKRQRKPIARKSSVHRRASASPYDIPISPLADVGEADDDDDKTYSGRFLLQVRNYFLRTKFSFTILPQTD